MLSSISMRLDRNTPAGILAITWACLMVILSSGPARAELPRTGQISCYDQDGNVIDHPGTGQDGDLQAGAVWPIPRFVNNGDGTITDRLTGLMWLMNGNCLGKMSWQGAVEFIHRINSDDPGNSCEDLTVVYKDWSLPSIWQLESLNNGQEQIVGDWLNKQGFRSMRPGGYWSATTGPNPYSAWLFSFDSGEVRQRIKVDYLSVLLVRKAGDAAAEVLSDAAGSKPDRFLDNGDGTVSDTETGLMWLQDGSCLGQEPWQNALDAIKAFNQDPESFGCQNLTASHPDWSLPNRLEMHSLIDHQADLPALSPDSHLTGIQPWYWTSTNVISRSDHAYEVQMGTGDVLSSPKQNIRGIMAVRPVKGRPERDRALLEPPDSPEFSLLRPIGARKDINWPSKRFTVYDDGTVTDNITGLMWLKDAGCFTVEGWEQSREVIGWLNTVPEKLIRKCADYTARYDDWQLPDLESLLALAAAAAEDAEPAGWLNSQGVEGLIARDYWTVTENPINLYHAWVVNLRQGTPRNYPKSFPLNFWPVRRPPGFRLGLNPEPFVKGNGENDLASIEQGTDFLLSVGVNRVKGVMPADYWLWYDAPEGTVRWLTASGEWVQKKTPVYHGNIFQLDEHPVFHADTVGLKPGNYRFHFSIEPVQQEEIYPLLFSDDFELAVVEIGETGGAKRKPGTDDRPGIIEEVIEH